MSTYGEFYPSSNNDNCTLDMTKGVTGVPASTIDQNTIWRQAKFGTSGSQTVLAGGDSGTHTAGWATTVVNTGFPPPDPISALQIQTRSVFLRFDTSSLDDDLEITGVSLGLYVSAIVNNYSSSFGSPTIRIFAGETGGSDRPTFSSPISTSADKNWYCEAAGGCGSSSCNANEGAVDVATIAHSSLSAGARNDISLSSGSYNDWINRTGYTYIWVTHNILYNTSSSTVCSNANDTVPVSIANSTAVKTTSVAFVGGTSGNAPYLAINQGKSRFQMVI